MLFDTHAHLFWHDFDEDRDEVIERARGAGVSAVLNLGTDPQSSMACIELAERFPECWAAAGFHPNDLEGFGADRDGGMAEIRDLLAHPRVIAVGETGLDYYRDTSDHDLQWESLGRHFELARESGLPIVLHNREADEDLRKALEAFDEGVTAVLHCFTGDEALGNWAIARGHYLGLGGVFTFPSSDLRTVVGKWNPDHLLLETDSPFLSPVPKRGRRNEPAHIVHTARAMADALGLDLDEVADRTTRNAHRLFGIEPERRGAVPGAS